VKADESMERRYLVPVRITSRAAKTKAFDLLISVPPPPGKGDGRPGDAPRRADH
jgi:hypothetical protein